MRIFLGIELPQEIKKHIELSVSPLQTTLKGWENPHDYHLTLLFIGETPATEIPAIIEEFKQISFTPFTLTLRNFEFFNRRVFYLKCDAGDELQNLMISIETHFSQYFKSGGKPFIPHITVKRWQRYEYDELKKRIVANPLKVKSIKVDHLALFKSEKDSDNRKYHVLERIYSTPTKSSTSTISTAR